MEEDFLNSVGSDYQVIYADPPWDYRDKRRDKPNIWLGGAKNHYNLMSIKEICALPVKEITAENSMLFLWITFPNLPLAFEVVEAWGFRYKTLGFSWIKTNKNTGKPFFGIGYYTKSNCEVCLLGVKGKPVKASDKVSSCVISQRREHSRKPDEVRERIVEFCGDVKRIELFARQRVEGWDCFGEDLS